MFFLVYYLVLVALLAFSLYWIIRLGVRHGVQDVERARQDSRPSLGPSADRLD